MPLADDLRLVGIGASAGGLEALRELMESLPSLGCFSYVIAQHVSPTHVSMLMSLLAPMTSLKVQDLVDKRKPEPGYVYITPPNKDVILENGLLRLTAPTATVGPKPSINRFFDSLANELGSRSLGIILSGTGSDGANGIRAIKAAGGITMAQEPTSAKYDGMPRAAILTGSVDLIVPPAKIGATLTHLLSVATESAEALDGILDTDDYSQIVNLVRMHSAFKLSDYKAPTVKRRIARRMTIVGVATLKEYVAYLRAHRDESQQLMRDTFISVTAFFRDREAFVALESAIGRIVNLSDDGRVIRCWVPGCATGEEVYSIAMLLEEALRSRDKNDVQYVIFASDMDEAALERARSGLYPTSDMDGIPKPLRDRYLDVVGDQYRISKSIRNRIVFARQNVIEDPPFGRMDLISCRNVLIYFVPEVQKRVLEVFHYALNPGACLMLGKSESVDQQEALFETMDRQSRLYKRREGVSHYSQRAANGMMSATEPAIRLERSPSGASTDMVTMQTLEQLTERYGPPSLVIDADDGVIHFQGDLKPFLKFPSGRANMYLFDLVDESMRTDLRAQVYSCRRTLEETRGATRALTIGGTQRAVTPVISPLKRENSSLLLLSFVVTPLEQGKAILANLPPEQRESLIINELEQELANTRAHLNVVVEELETSNEELQSTNEELLTVNEELQVKSAELEVTAADLTNVKESLTFPLLVVDSQLLVTQANRATTDIVASAGPLEGCSLTSLQWQLDIPGLAGLVRRVVETGRPYHTQLRGNEHIVYSLQVMPYQDAGQMAVGAVLVFEDISARYAIENALRISEERFRLMATSVKDYAIIFLDADGSINSWNIGAQRIKGYTADEVLGHPMAMFYTTEERAAGKPGALLAQAVAEGKVEDEGWRIRKDGSLFFADVIISALRNENGELLGFAKITRDISERRQAEIALRESESRFRQVAESLPQLIWTCAPDGPCDYLSPQWVAYTGVSEADQLGYGWLEQLHPDDRQRAIDHWMATAAVGRNFEIEFRIRRHDGEYRWFRTLAVPLRSTSGAIIKWYGSNTDIDESKQATEALRESESRVNRALDAMPEAVMLIDDKGVIAQCNARTSEIFGYARDELLGRSVESLIPARLRGEHVQQRQTYLSNPSTRLMGAGRDLHGLHKDGHEVPVEVALAPMVEGDANHVVVSVVDISERKQIEREVVRLKERYQLLFDGSPDAYVIMNSDDGAISDCNAAAEALLRGTWQQLRGKTFADLSPALQPDNDASAESVNDRLAAMAKAGHGRVEWQLQLMDGALCWVEINVATLQFAEYPAVFVALRDIGARKSAEFLTAARTLELERSNAELEQFAYVASHDLQEPLRMVASYTELLSQRYHSQLDEKADRYINFAVEGAKRMQSLLNDLLAYSRVGTQGNKLKEVAIGKVVQAALDNLTVAVSESKGEVTVDDMPQIAADKTQMIQVFQNLIGNALKFTREGVPPKVHVSVKQTGNEWVFSVRDNGIGIDARYHDRIFRVFQRLHARTKYAGSGIGLAITKKIIERHGGRIWIESAEGMGTAFHFTVPVTPHESGA
ncbi:MAG: PAS domain S-box protein [Gammaproteobacteria bacterium]|nr:PAS domain S-box protein [Gammaproteobacteria bacterium]